MDSDRTQPSPLAPPASPIDAAGAASAPPERLEPREPVPDVSTPSIPEPWSPGAASLDEQMERGLAAALAEPESAAPEGLIDGKYVLERLIGQGGMSRVFEATHCLTGRRVALKLLHARRDSAPLDPRRLFVEARAIARIEHPHVVQVLDMGFVEREPYLVMERLRGHALDVRLAEGGPMSTQLAVALLEPVLGAAHTFHAAGVVHRDLKPANLFVVEDGVSAAYLKILDFGVASLAPEGDEGVESLKLTEPGMAVGTPFYMAPEQLRRDAADARSDVFALGAILYEMVTGKRPFPARDLTDLVVMMVSEDPAQRLRRLTRDVPVLGPILARALAHRPEDRFQTARDFQLALAAVAPGAKAGRSSSEMPRAAARESSERLDAVDSRAALASTDPRDEPAGVEGIRAMRGVAAGREPSRTRQRRISMLLVGAVAIGAGVAFQLARATGHDHPPPAPNAQQSAVLPVLAAPGAVAPEAVTPKAVAAASPPEETKPSQPAAEKPAAAAPPPVTDGARRRASESGSVAPGSVAPGTRARRNGVLLEEGDF